MKKTLPVKFLLLTAILVGFSACGDDSEKRTAEENQTTVTDTATPETNTVPTDERSPSDDEMNNDDSGEIVVPLENQPNPIPVNPPNPAPPSEANPAPPINLIPSQGNLNERVEAVLSQNPSVQVANRTNLRDSDTTQALEKIYQIVVPTVTFPDGTDYLGPYTRIHPLANSTIRFFKSATLLRPVTSFIEIDFQVAFGNAIDYVPEENAWRECDAGNSPPPGHYRQTYRTDWVQFHLKACSETGHCQEVLHDIRPVQECDPQATSCQQSYQVHVDASRLPGGSIAANHHYVISVEGTDAALDINQCGGATICQGSADCSGTRPFCEAGVCSGVADRDYYRALTPANFN